MKSKKVKTVSRSSVQRFVLPLMNVGACLSNIAFNLKQGGALPEASIASCDHYYREWDAAMHNVPAWIRN